MGYDNTIPLTGYNEDILLMRYEGNALTQVSGFESIVFYCKSEKSHIFEELYLYDI